MTLPPLHGASLAQGKVTSDLDSRSGAPGPWDPGVLIRVWSCCVAWGAVSLGFPVCHVGGGEDPQCPCRDRPLGSHFCGSLFLCRKLGLDLAAVATVRPVHRAACGCCHSNGPGLQCFTCAPGCPLGAEASPDLAPPGQGEGLSPGPDGRPWLCPSSQRECGVGPLLTGPEMQPLLPPRGSAASAAVSQGLHLPWSLCVLGLLSLSRALDCARTRSWGPSAVGKPLSPPRASHKQRDPAGSLKPPSQAELLLPTPIGMLKH